jgi:hypothetical protein
MISLVRHLLRAHALRKRVAAEIARRRGEIVDHDGLRVDLAELAAGLAARHRHADAAALLAAPVEHLARAVRKLATVEPDQVPGESHARVRVAGLLELACDACGRRYPGSELHMHSRANHFAVDYEGRCPQGHPLPALAAQVVVR